jgi:threonylcarbamoyladenosine tRNA methylthiotransferase MtaB
MGMTGVFQIVPSEHKEKIVNIILGKEIEALYHFHDRARPYLKVQDGCNFSCSYCAVPLARGRSRSLSPEKALERAHLIEAEGYHEVVLTGIHLGSYGRDLPKKTSLADLIKSLITRTGITRIRLSSIEINEVDDELLELLTDARVCRHLHLPLQSGSDEVLRRMNRNYSAGTFIQKMRSISARLNDISIGSDVIVGFPGEKDDDFDRTYRIIEDLPFAYLHIFPYSSRAGTAASRMKQEVPAKIIAGRAAALKTLSNLKREHFASRHMHQTLDVIMEEKDGQGHMTGTASNYLKIRVLTESVHPGTLVFVRPDSLEGYSLKGFVVS